MGLATSDGASRLVGRDAELRALHTVLHTPPPWAIVIDGEAGIGKTTLWRASLDALQPGPLVLSTRGTQAESALGFAGLTDILRTVPDQAMAALPAPQRAALEAATLRRAVGDEPVDARAISTGLTSLLSALAAEQTVVVAVDDVQWLDAASVGPLEFAARRAPVGVLVTMRGSAGVVPVASASVGETMRTTLGALTIGALHHVLQRALGQALLRPALVRVAHASGGNPMYAIELARAMHRRGDSPATGPLPLPESLADLMHGRLAVLDDSARRTVLFAALAARPTIDLLQRSNALGGLDAAERASVLVIDRGRVELTHPLLASAAVELTPAPERRAAHAELAAAVDGDELRARHLALASPAPTEVVAAALDAAVSITNARGATAAAADLARLAIEHTPVPTDPAGLQRAATLAQLSFEIGDAAECERLHRFVFDNSADPRVRGNSALQLAEVLWERGDLAECIAMAKAALDESSGDPDLAARSHLTLAVLGENRTSNTAAALAIVEEHEVDLMTRAWAHFQRVANEYEAGRGMDLKALDAALDMERTGRSWRSTDQVASSRAAILKFVDELDAAQHAFDELHQRAVEEGNDGQLPYIVGHLVGVHVLRGDLEAATAAAHEHVQLAELTGQDNQRWQASINLAAVALAAGRFGEAAVAIEGVADNAFANARRTAAGVQGTVALRRGDVPAAVARLDEWWRLTRQLGGDVGTSRFHAERAEAMITAGDLDGAAAFITDVESIASAAGRRSVLASMARSRALLAAAAGDIGEAVNAATHALDLHDDLPLRIERARTLLVKGQLHRRAREKAKARDSLTAALMLFEAAGADGWAELARAELARVNIRPAAPRELTVTERRIAELAADGLTNSEIAAAAFVSTKTVEANLSRAYRKLGIGSRAELGRVMATER